MSTEVIFYCYFVILSLSVIIGALRYKILDKSTRVIFLLLCFTWVSELTGRIISLFMSGRTPIYHVSCIVSFFLISVYFISGMPITNKRRYIAAMATVLPLIGIANCIFFQPITHLNTNTLLLRGFVVILMALYALYRILLDETINPLHRYPHFWLWTLLLILYTGTYFFWSYINILSNHGKGRYQDLVQYIQAVLNIVVYTGIGLTLFYYPKLQKT